jgi:hypothetical protein
LRFDRPQNRLLALRQEAQLDQPGFELADLLFVEPPGLVLPIAGDEGHRVASIQQFDHALDLAERDVQRLGHGSQIDGGRIAPHADFYAARSGAF